MPEQVAEGLPFAEACSILRRRFEGKQRVWASYGDHNRRQFEGQCHVEGVCYRFSSGHINVETLVAVACGFPREMGMSGVLERLGLPHEGTHHDASDDAWNMAAIPARVLSAVRKGSPLGH